MARTLLPSRGDANPHDTMGGILSNIVYPAAGGVAGIAITDVATTTVDVENAPAQYLRITGSLTATRTVILSRDEGAPALLFVENATAGAQSVVIKYTSGGTGVTVGNGKVKIIVSTDGVNARDVNALF